MVRLELPSLKGEPIVRLILDGTAVRVRLDRRAILISLLVALGVRRDGQKVLWRSRAWAGKARPPGERCSTISLRAGYPSGGGGLVLIDGAVMLYS